MNPPPTPPLIRPPASRGWFWFGLTVLLLPLVAFSVIALGVASYFHLGSDTRALRNGLMKANGGEWRQYIGLNVGGLTLGAVRAGLSFAPLDAKAQAAVRTVRGVEIGIFELAPGAKPPNRAAMLTDADAAMQARGWERVVGVLDGEDLMGVYVPGTNLSVRQLKCCVAVFDGRRLVVVLAQGKVEPLVKCLLNETERRAKLRTLATR